MAVDAPRRAAPADVPAGARALRRPFRDNPVLILVVMGLLLAALIAIVGVVNRSVDLAPDYLSEVVLYALTALDLAMLAVLALLLARNIVKLVVERRRGLPFARFQTKLVLLLLGSALVPAGLVVAVGGEVIRKSAERWFSAPVDQVLASSREVASDYYEVRERAVTGTAGALARRLAATSLSDSGLAELGDAVRVDIGLGRVGLVEVYRVVETPSAVRVEPVVNWAAPSLPRGYSAGVADRLAAQVASGPAPATVFEPLPQGGELVRAAALVPGPPGGRPAGVVVASEYVDADLARHSRRIVEAYEGYQQLRVLQRPLQGVYLAFFGLTALLVLLGAAWLGPYVAKRITRPIQAMAEAAREIGAGHFEHRLVPDTRDEFGGLVDAFNTMAHELSTSRDRLEQSRRDLERKNLEVEERRRYIEAILERIATGVISVNADGRIGTVNGAAQRLLQLDGSAAGRPLAAALSRDELEPLRKAIERRVSGRGPDPGGQEVALVIDGRDLHLALATTPMPSQDGIGLAIVLDDVSPLIRAQKVAAWRDVARRLAHEVKNPLTPIQLCAERMRRHFSQAPEPTRALVEECSTTIVQEVESLKLLVDEFSQFARMPAPRTVPSDLNQLVRDVLSLYRDLLGDIRIEARLTAVLPLVRVDPEQFRRVVLNLVDNSVEALRERPAGGVSGVISIETEHDPVAAVVRVVVADNGPGIPGGDHARLFLPYYSTKQRGSGLGLSIVRRIVVEHGGNIEASDNVPRGTRMTIELPC